MSEQIRCCPECGYPGWDKRKDCHFCGLKKTGWTSFVGQLRDMLQLKHFRNDSDKPWSAAPQRTAKILAAGGVLAVCGGLYWYFMSPTWGSADPSELAEIEQVRDPETDTLAKRPARTDMQRDPLDSDAETADTSPASDSEIELATSDGNADRSAVGGNPTDLANDSGPNSTGSPEVELPPETTTATETTPEPETTPDPVQAVTPPSLVDLPPVANGGTTQQLPTQVSNPSVAGVGVTPDELPALPVPETEGTAAAPLDGTNEKPSTASAAEPAVSHNRDPSPGSGTVDPKVGPSPDAPSGSDSNGTPIVVTSANDTATGQNAGTSPPNEPRRLNLSRSFRGHLLILEPINP